MRILGLPWPEWGDTALLLLWAGAELRAARCPCGCGQWAEESLDPATEGHWGVDFEECYARKALHEFGESDKPPAHALVRVRRVDPDDAEQVYDPARAAQIYAEHMAKYQ